MARTYSYGKCENDKLKLDDQSQIYVKVEYEVEVINMSNLSWKTKSENCQGVKEKTKASLPRFRT